LLASELAEIRSAFRERIKTEPVRNQPVRRKTKVGALPTLVRELDNEGGEVMRPSEVAEFFEVTTLRFGAGPTPGCCRPFARSADSAGSDGRR
jgi:hypothetical protein